MNSIIEECKVINVIQPQTLSSVSVGDWINMKDYQHASFIVGIGATTNASTTMRIRQAVNASGGTPTTFDPGYFHKSAIYPSDTFTKTSTTSSAMPVGASSDDKEYVIEVDAQDLADSKDFITLDVTDASSDCEIHAIAILSKPRYSQATNPTALA